MSAQQQQELPPLHELPAYSPRFHDPNSFHLPSVPSTDPAAFPSGGLGAGVASLSSTTAGATGITTTAGTRQTLSSLPLTSNKAPQQQNHHHQHQRSLSIQDLISSPIAENMEVQSQQSHQYFPVAPHHVLPSVSSPRTSQNNMDTDMASTAGDLESVVSASERSIRAGSVLSMDDPDVRIAAEALGDLRADFVTSPPPQHSNLPGNSTVSSPEHIRSGDPSQPEPLLSLLSSTHPLLSTAIHGSLSAYSSSKSYSPRFKYGAEFVERHIGSPVASTVNTVGRKTGVEGGVRWWLNRRGSGRAEEGGNDVLRSQTEEDEAAEESASKRRKVDRDAIAENNSQMMDLERGFADSTTGCSMPAMYNQQRRPSQASFAESLPAYDDQKSPSYELNATSLVPAPSEDSQRLQNPNWQTRLMLSTSGLGVAMSEESLRSLKYCLTWLRWANVHLGKVIVALKTVLEEWDQSQQQQQQQSQSHGEKSDNPPPEYSANEKSDNQQPSEVGGGTSLIPAAPANSSPEALAKRVAALKTDVLHTLKKVVDIVSTYAGGRILPEQARMLVRRHLVSLPQRFHIASAGAGTDVVGDEVAVRAGAQRVLVLAREGLDMMAQVSGVVGGTIERAEEWVERLGRGRGRGSDVEMTMENEKGGMPTGLGEGKRGWEGR